MKLLILITASLFAQNNPGVIPPPKFITFNTKDGNTCATNMESGVTSCTLLCTIPQVVTEPNVVGPKNYWDAKFPENSPNVTANLIPAAKLVQMGVPNPPGFTDHIQVRVTNLDPATVKVTILLAYFDGNDEVKIERTVSRNEAGAYAVFYVADAAKITGIDAKAEEFGLLSPH